METNVPQPTDSQLFETDDRLSRVISHVYGVQQALDAESVAQQLLPNYEMLLALNFGPPIAISTGGAAQFIERTVVIGPLQHVLRYELPPGADLLVVNFTLNGFYRLLGRTLRARTTPGVYASEAFVDQAILLDLWADLSRQPTQKKRLQTLYTYFLAHLTNPSPNQSTEILLDTIPLFRQTAIDPVKVVADSYRVTSRTVQQHFQTQLGFSAKEMARFLRFKRVLTYLLEPATKPVDWLTMVQQFGYHDQPHLIRDFQYFVGTSPRRFLAELQRGRFCVAREGKFY